MPESYYSGALHENMSIRSSNPVYVFQATAANTSSATSEFNFIPPLACYLTREIDAIRISIGLVQQCFQEFYTSSQPQAQQ